MLWFRRLKWGKEHNNWFDFRAQEECRKYVEMLQQLSTWQSHNKLTTQRRVHVKKKKNY